MDVPLSRTLLVVDDEADARFTFRQILKNLGCVILEASDGVSALEVIRDTHVDLVVTDVRMPRMDGMSLLKTIKETSKNIEVIVITAYGQTTDAVEAMSLGAYDYISKPVSKNELISKVENALRKTMDQVEM